MTYVECEKIEIPNTAQSIKSKVDASSFLKLAERYLLKEGQIYVEIIDNTNAKKAVEDLISIVKSSPANSSCPNYIQVVNCCPQLSLSYQKNICFWQGSNVSGTRITRISAIDFIASLKVHEGTDLMTKGSG